MQTGGLKTEHFSEHRDSGRKWEGEGGRHTGAGRDRDTDTEELRETTEKVRGLQTPAGSGGERWAGRAGGAGRGEGKGRVDFLYVMSVQIVCPIKMSCLIFYY